MNALIEGAFARASDPSFIAGSVDTYGDLPTAVEHVGEFWLVRENSGGLLSILGSYKYPKGIYSPNASNVWEQVPFSVKVAEDSTTLVNITNWADFVSYVEGVNIGDRIVYNGLDYESLTGVVTSTNPENDTTNWGIVRPNTEQTFYVSSRGGDFTTVKDAVAAADGVTKTTILVAPGVYNEDNPIAGKSEVTVKALGGQNTVEIVASNANQNLFDSTQAFFLEDMTLKGVSGAGKYAVEMLSTGATLLDDIVIEDCSNGVHLNNAGGQIIARDVALQGTMTTGIFVEAGNISCGSISVVGFSAVTTIANITGVNSIATLTNILSFSSNVTTGLFIQDQARVVSNISNFVGMQDGVVLEGGCDFRATGLTIFNATQDGLRINDVGADTNWACNGCTIEDSTRYDINILSATATAKGVGTSAIDKLNFVPGAEVYGMIVDVKEDDEGVNVLGELHVGIPEQGAESVLGEGDSYTRGMLVYTETAGGVFTDVSEDARSPSGSTFTFPGTAADNAIYVASSLANASDFLAHYGIKTSVDTGATLGAGNFVVEYWNGSIWTPVNIMETDSDGSYYQYANNIFEDSGGRHIRYDIALAADSWSKNDPMLLGTDYYWIRFRVENAITTAPVFQQFKVHSNRREINADGWPEYFGVARPEGTLPLNIGVGRELSGSMVNQNIWSDQNVGAGLVNNRFSATNQYFGWTGVVPDDLDTSSPIRLKVGGVANYTGTIDISVSYNWVSEGDLVYSANPAPSSNANTKTVTLTAVPVVAGEVKIVDFDLDVAEVRARKNPVDGTQPDILFFTVSTPTIAGRFELFYADGKYTRWCDGGHV